MGEITRYPICWPDNVARTAPQDRRPALFSDKTVAGSVKLVLAEINRLNKQPWFYDDEDVIISTNIRPKLDGLPSGNEKPQDPGAAVFFKLRFWRGAKEFKRHTVLTCDRWTTVAWNLYAIARDIDAQRARARWGCTSVEQAFHGYLAIPERCGGPSWWQTLGVSPGAPLDEIKDAFLTLAKTRHPDKGGTVEQWNQLIIAHEQALARFPDQTP
jgi:hypothetical protein